jgi:hypothetical protein
VETLDEAQVVEIFWNERRLGDYRGNSHCGMDIDVPPGVNVLRFNPALPGKVLPSDSRRLAFRLYVTPDPV